MGLPQGFNKACFDILKSSPEFKKQLEAMQGALAQNHVVTIIDMMFHIRAWASMLITETTEEKDWGREGLENLFLHRAQAMSDEGRTEDAERITRVSMEILDPRKKITIPADAAKVQRLAFARFYVQQLTIEQWKQKRIELKDNKEARKEWCATHMSPGDQYVDACTGRLLRMCTKEEDRKEIQRYFWPPEYAMFAPYSETTDRHTRLQDLAKKFGLVPDEAKWKTVFPEKKLLSDNPFWDARIPQPHSAFKLAQFFVNGLKNEPIKRCPIGTPEYQHRLVLQFDKGKETSPLKCATTPRTRYPLLEDEKEELGFFSLLKAADEDKAKEGEVIDKPMHAMRRMIDTKEMAPYVYQSIALAIIRVISAFSENRAFFKDWEIIIDGAFPGDRLPDGRYKPRIYKVQESTGLVALPDRPELHNKDGEGDHAIPRSLRVLVPADKRVFVLTRDTDMVEYLTFYWDTVGKHLNQDITMHAKSVSSQWGIDYTWDIRACCDAFPRFFWGCPNLASFFGMWNIGGTDIVPKATCNQIPLTHLHEELRARKVKNVPCPLKAPPFDIACEPVDPSDLADLKRPLWDIPLKRPLIVTERANFKTFVALYLEGAKHKFPELKEEGPNGPWYYELKKKQKGTKEPERRYLQIGDSGKQLTLTQLQIVFRQVRVQFRFALLFCMHPDEHHKAIGLEKGPDGRSLYGFEISEETGRVVPATKVTGDHRCLVQRPTLGGGSVTLTV